MRGRGICSILCLNWIVLDQRTDKITPVLQNCTSERQRCFSGSNRSRDGIRRFDLRKKEKKATKQAAQKDKSKERFRSKTARMPRKMEEVMGNFCWVMSPLSLRRPFKIEDKYQLSDKGLGQPASKCINRTMFKYCLIEEKLSLVAKNAIYRPRFAGVTGTGEIPRLKQNCKYSVC